jgi:hypothetical protein
MSLSDLSPIRRIAAMIDERYTPRDKDVRCYICHGIDRYGDSTVFCPCCQVFVHYTCINDANDYLVFFWGKKKVLGDTSNAGLAAIFAKWPQLSPCCRALCPWCARLMSHGCHSHLDVATGPDEASLLLAGDPMHDVE